MFNAIILALKAKKWVPWVIGILLLLTLVACSVIAFERWRSGVYEQGFQAAKAQCELQKAAYQAGVTDAVAAIEKVALDAVARIEKADGQAAANIEAVLTKALDKWKKNPFVVYNERTKECQLTPDFVNTWNELNAEANRLATPPGERK